MEREQVYDILLEGKQASLFQQGVFGFYAVMALSAAFASRAVPENENVYGHGLDFFLTAEVYFASKIIFSRNGWMLREEIVAPLAFSAGASLELAQKFGLCPGTYDPKDFIAYGLGAAVSYGLGKVTNLAFKNVEVEE